MTKRHKSKFRKPRPKRVAANHEFSHGYKPGAASASRLRHFALAVGGQFYLNENYQPVQRTPLSHGYSYDGYVAWENTEIEKYRQKINGSDYHDRMQEWDYEKYMLCYRKAELAGSRRMVDQPELTEHFLQLYYDDPDIVLIRLMDYCNVSNGYPTYRFDYFSPKAAERESVRALFEQHRDGLIEKIEKFVETRTVAQKATWVETSLAQIYVRWSTRFIEGRRVECLDLANVSLRDEKLMNKGFFREFVRALVRKHSEWNFFVENIAEPDKLQKMFERFEFKRDSHFETCCMYRLAPVAAEDDDDNV